MKLSKTDFIKAKNFILANARMIERRLFQFYFENGSAEGVYHAVYAYRNSDGGFGHGLEPDTASPESQPLFTVMAMEILDEVNYLTPQIIRNDFMPYFENITTGKGGIPWMFKPKDEYPCEDHFKTVKEWAALSTTSSLLGILLKYNIEIPWMDPAEKFVWNEFKRIQNNHVFCYLCVPRWLVFLENCRNKNKAQNKIDELKKWILEDGVLWDDPSDDGWGLYEKPHRLNYAPHPKSILFKIFSEEAVSADLDTLIDKQKTDGRWETWYGISAGTKLEWAGIQTLWSLKVLQNYDRIEW